MQVDITQDPDKCFVEYDHIAKVQLFYAIDLYNQEVYIPAVTLAGAAEEYLNKILKKEKQAFNIFKNNLLNNDNYKKEDVEKIVKDVCFVKNKFKHGFTYDELEKRDDPLEFPIKDVARGYILSALMNYIEYYKEFDVKREWPTSFHTFIETHINQEIS